MAQIRKNVSFFKSLLKTRRPLVLRTILSLPVAEVREEIILTDAAPPTPSPVPSFSPAKSATSVEVAPPSSPVSNPSPEYTGLSTTGNEKSPKALEWEAAV